MIWNRRDFLKTGAAGTLASFVSMRGDALPPRVISPFGGPPSLVVAHGDPELKNLAMTALDAARAAGATYTDVRLTYTRWREFDLLGEHEELAIGVRALVNGIWGFASSPYWTTDSAARLGKEAAAQAKANAFGRSTPVELGNIPVIANGTWTTPLQIDPFEMPVGEIRDWKRGITAYGADAAAMQGLENATAEPTVYLGKQHCAFASSEGSYLTQTLYTTRASIFVNYKQFRRAVDRIGALTAGWDAVVDADQYIRDAIPRIFEEMAQDIRLPEKPVDPSRFSVVFDRGAIATLLGETIGAASELDRALGYEANAGGTSYLGPDPFTYLGTQIASPLLTVTANRSTPKAMATVKWDGEGVAPRDFTLVKDGTLVDYQTTRALASQLAPWYQKRGTTAESSGCASSPTALDLTMQHTPNLAMAPSTTNANFDTLVSGMGMGLAVRGVGVSMDQQHMHGLGRVGELYEVKGGKRVARIMGGGFLFRAQELWKNLIAIGGPDDFRWVATGRSEKGEPSQTTEYSVGAVPAAVKDVSVIDLLRKA